MIGTPYATACALLSIVVSVAALSFSIGTDIGRASTTQTTLIRSLK